MKSERWFGFRSWGRHIVLVLVSSATLLGLGGTVSSAPARQEFPAELDFSGPFRLYHGARLHVERIQIGQAGDQWSAGDVTFRFRLDVGECPSIESEMGDAGSFYREIPVAESLGIDDCPYGHQETRGPMNLHDDEVLNADIWVPDPTQRVSTSQLPMFRYGHDLVRARIGGIEYDVSNEEFMGGAVMAVYCGYPRSPDECDTRWIDFDTCLTTPSGNIEEWPCYQLQGRLVIEPTRHSPDDHLDVTQVLGSASRCVGDHDFTLGVHLVNPERVATDAFHVRVARLDPETRSIVETWDSSSRPGLGPDETTDAAVPITVQLGGGHHDLMIAAMSGRDLPDVAGLGRAAYMGTSVELSLTCFPDFTDLPSVVVRTATPTSQRQGPQIEVVAPTPTATPTPTIERPGPTIRGAPTPRGS